MKKLENERVSDCGNKIMATAQFRTKAIAVSFKKRNKIPVGYHWN